MLRTAPVVALLSLLASSASAQSVWVVDPQPGPGVDFALLADAVAAAASGDVLLVRGVSHAPLVLDGKGLTVVADEGFEPFLFGNGPGVSVRNLPAGQSVVVRGFIVERNPTLPGPKTEIVDCAGSVWIEDCRNQVSGFPSVRVADSADVVLHACDFRGLDGAAFSPVPPSPALVLVDSRVALHGSVVRGGNGRPATVSSSFVLVATPQPGAPAITMAGGELYLANGVISGGSGGSGFHDVVGCIDPQAGGPGVVLDAAAGGAAPLVVLAGAELMGGAGGTAFTACPNAAPDGPAQIVNAGSVVGHPIQAPAFTLDSPVREGELVTLATSAAPALGQFAAVLIGTAPASLPLAPDLGVLLVTAPELLVLGALAPNGTLDVPLVAPSIVPPSQALVLHLQSLVCGPSGCALGSASQLVLLDAAR